MTSRRVYLIWPKYQEHLGLTMEEVTKAFEKIAQPIGLAMDQVAAAFRQAADSMLEFGDTFELHERVMRVREWEGIWLW